MSLLCPAPSGSHRPSVIDFVLPAPRGSQVQRSDTEDSEMGIGLSRFSSGKTLARYGWAGAAGEEDLLLDDDDAAEADAVPIGSGTEVRCGAQAVLCVPSAL